MKFKCVLIIDYKSGPTYHRLILWELRSRNWKGDNWLALVTGAHGESLVTLGPSWGTWGSPLSSLHGSVRIRLSITCNKYLVRTVCHYTAVGWRVGCQEPPIPAVLFLKVEWIGGKGEGASSQCPLNKCHVCCCWTFRCRPNTSEHLTQSIRPGKRGTQRTMACL